jgi:sec-independent protein translocase protein TatB
MEILGVGPSELIFILIIALIVLGPKDMQKAGKTIGKWMRDIVTSDGWKIFQQTSRELKTLPNRLMRDANNEINQIGNDLNNSINPTVNPTSSRPNNLSTPPRSQPMTTAPAAKIPENKIEPPAPEKTQANKDNQEEEEKDA